MTCRCASAVRFGLDIIRPAYRKRSKRRRDNWFTVHRMGQVTHSPVREKTRNCGMCASVNESPNQCTVRILAQAQKVDGGEFVHDSRRSLRWRAPHGRVLDLCTQISLHYAKKGAPRNARGCFSAHRWPFLPSAWVWCSLCGRGAHRKNHDAVGEVGHALVMQHTANPHHAAICHATL